MLLKIKELALTKGLESYLEHLLSLYGLEKIAKLKITKFDLGKGEITLTLELDGEPTPIELGARYTILPSNQIQLGEVHASRRWIARLVNEAVPANLKRFDIPAAATSLL